MAQYTPNHTSLPFLTMLIIHLQALFSMKTPFLQRDGSLYKFIWVRHGTLDVEVDHVVMHLGKRGNDFAHSFASCADKGSGR